MVVWTVLLQKEPAQNLFICMYNPNKGQRDVKNVVVLGGKYQKSKTPEVVVVPLTIFVFINNNKI